MMPENTSNYTQEEKEKLIKREMSRLRRIFKDIPKDKKDTALSLMKNAAFMAITLDDLQETINFQGPVTEYQNGENQWGTKKSPEVEIYNVMIKNHMTVIKQLCDLLPRDDPKPKEDVIAASFGNFITGREDFA